MPGLELYCVGVCLGLSYTVWVCLCPIDYCFICASGGPKGRYMYGLMEHHDNDGPSMMGGGRFNRDSRDYSRGGNKVRRCG